MKIKDLGIDLGAAMRAALKESPYSEKDLALKAGILKATLDKWIYDGAGERGVIFLLCLDRMDLDPSSVLPDEACRTMRESRLAISEAVGDATKELTDRHRMDLVFGDLVSSSCVYGWRGKRNIDTYIKLIRVLKLLDVSLIDVMDRDTMRTQDEARRRLRKIRQGREA